MVPSRPLGEANGSGKIDFDDISSAFKHKSNAEILRGVVVFSACNIPALVKNSERMISLSEVRREVCRRCETN